ncbi:trypsin-like peptidase domain-containing protein [Mycoplasmatota bacterium]|nr:trypsin-like peptidase domain-containing protein [Mycoplasmatota bacterium]
MQERKQIFLVGTVIGGLVGVFLFVLVYVVYHFDGEKSKTPINKISYQVNVDSVINQAIKKASPSVVGIVRFKNNRESGTGSGVVYKLTKDRAYIVTNYHVIKDGSKVEVAFQNEERVEAEVIGDDVITDLAVISIPKGNLTEYMDFSDSGELNVGEFVFAIGNPLGLNFYGSATLGIVSSIERLIPIDIDKDGESDWFAHVIQTDAAINPGNSGGALVNVDGKLIGINSMKISSTQVEGIGFSIPSNIVYQVVNDLENYGSVKRPFIGIHPISISKLSTEEKKGLGIDYLTKGIYVNDVTPNSSAQKSGIEIDDVIVKVNEDEVKDVTDFRYKIYQHELGDEIKLTIIRGNKRIEIKFNLEPHIDF